MIFTQFIYITRAKKLACKGFFATCFNRNGGFAAAKPQATIVADKILFLSRFDVITQAKKLARKDFFATCFNRNGGFAPAKPQATIVADKILFLSRFDVIIYLSTFLKEEL